MFSVSARTLEVTRTHTHTQCSHGTTVLGLLRVYAVLSGLLISSDVTEPLGVAESPSPSCARAFYTSTLLQPLSFAMVRRRPDDWFATPRMPPPRIPPPRIPTTANSHHRESHHRERIFFDLNIVTRSPASLTAAVVRWLNRTDQAKCVTSHPWCCLGPRLGLR